MIRKEEMETNVKYMKQKQTTTTKSKWRTVYYSTEINDLTKTKKKENKTNETR